jgi:hypothetical protein
MYRSAAALAATAMLVAVPSASEGRSTANRCLQAARAHGNRVVARDRLAIVFANPNKSYFVGCLYANGRMRRLDVCCADAKFRLAGRFAAYTYTGTAIGDETSKLGVYDLRTGRLRAIAKLAPHSEGGGREIETGALVRSFVVNSSGSVAWIQSGPLYGPAGPAQGSAEAFNRHSELRTGAGRPPRERVVDNGNIAPGSLKLVARGRRISWSKDGHTRSAALG